MHIKQGILTIQGERLMITDYKYVQLPYWQNTMKLQKKKLILMYPYQSAVKSKKNWPEVSTSK